MCLEPIFNVVCTYPGRAELTTSWRVSTVKDHAYTTEDVAVVACGQLGIRPHRPPIFSTVLAHVCGERRWSVFTLRTNARQAMVGGTAQTVQRLER